MRFPEEPVASIFFTLSSLFFIALFFFLALIFEINELVLFCLTLLIIGIGTLLWSRINLKNVTCDIDTDKSKLFPGETMVLALRAINKIFLPVLIRIKLPIDKALVGDENGEEISEEFGLLWYQRVTYTREYTPQKRGVYKLGPPYLRIGDIFGFFPIEKDSTGNHEIIVYPRIVNVKRLILPKREFFGIPGAQSPVEDPVFIFGTRDYQPGSPARRIHWKASARHDRLQEKLCEPAEQEKIFIALDVSRFEEENADDAFEELIEVAASVTLQFSRLGYPLGFVTNGRIKGPNSRIVPITGSPQQLSFILELLARLEIKKEDNLSDILSNGYRLPWGVSCLHLSYEKNKDIKITEAYFKERKVPTKFLVSKNNPLDEEGYSNGSSPVCLDEILIGEESNR